MQLEAAADSYLQRAVYVVTHSRIDLREMCEFYKRKCGCGDTCFVVTVAMCCMQLSLGS